MSTHKMPELGDWNSWEELRELQDAQLAQQLVWATRTEFWKDRGCSLKGDDPRAMLDSAPLTSKADLRGSYPFGMLAVPRKDVATYHESSGTAGSATPSYYTEADWIDLCDRYARKWVGLGPGDTVMVRTPYALMVTGHLAQAAARS